jgi:hypothetical protein
MRLGFPAAAMSNSSLAEVRAASETIEAGDPGNRMDTAGPAGALGVEVAAMMLQPVHPRRQGGS